MSKITVTTIAGLTSGGDANTVKIESGDAFNVVSGATTLGGDLTVDTSVLKVDATNNRVGIGTASPSFAISAVGGSRYQFSPNTSSGGGLAIQEVDSSTVGLYGINHDNNAYKEISFFNSASESCRIRSTGIAIGGTGDANTLDDYEEGTWTPTAGSNAGTINTAIGKYTKVGRVVYIVAYIESTGMATGSSRTYGGLPFAVNNLASQTSVDYQGFEWSNNSGGGIYFEGGSSNFVNNYLNTFRGSFAATDNSRFQGFYFTD